MSLVGKRVLVTGGSKGLGLDIAKFLSVNGADIVLLARSKDLLQHNVENELSKTHESQKHSFIECDLTKLESIQEVVHANNSGLRGTSVLINAAGVSQNSLLISTKTPAITEIVNTNLTSSIILTQLLLKHLLSSKPSSIINVSSVLGIRGLKGTSVYSATKAGLAGFTRSLAQELGSKQIRVNCISPGLVQETSMGKGYHFENALQRDSVSIDEITKTVLFLINNESITGQNIVVDNGYIC